MVLITVVASQVSEDSGSLLPRRGSGLYGLAVLTLAQSGEVTSWSVTAARFFGLLADDVVGRDVCDVLLTGPGQRELLKEALAQAAAGRVWTSVVQISAPTGSRRVALHCEPLGAAGGALMIARQPMPEPGQASSLADAATLIGTTLDIYRTAGEAADVAVPAFADAATIFVSERLLVADELGPYPAGPAVVRRLVSRLNGYPASVTDGILRPGEVLVFNADSPSYRAMTARCPVLFDQVDDNTAEWLARRPGGHEIIARYTSMLTVPLVARGTVLGSVTFPHGRQERIHASRCRTGRPACLAGRDVDRQRAAV